MIQLTVQELEDKIRMVESDLSGSTDEKVSMALGAYVDYLKDELRALKKNEGQ